MRNGIIAAVIIVVAGVFFTIGWFTSTRGEHERCGVVDRVAEQMNKPQWNVPQSGANQQGSDQWQGRPGGGWGMGPSQHEQGQDQTVPKGESQSGGSSTQQAPSTEQGYLGVWLETVTPELQEQHGLSSSNGALIATIDGSGPARQAGIRRGDVIISIDGTSVTQQEDVVDLITQRQAGESVSVTVDRKGQSLTFRVTLAERPASVSG